MGASLANLTSLLVSYQFKYSFRSSYIAACNSEFEPLASMIIPWKIALSIPCFREQFFHRHQRILLGQHLMLTELLCLELEIVLQKSVYSIVMAHSVHRRSAACHLYLFQGIKAFVSIQTNWRTGDRMLLGSFYKSPPILLQKHNSWEDATNPFFSHYMIEFIYADGSQTKCNCCCLISENQKVFDEELRRRSDVTQLSSELTLPYRTVSKFDSGYMQMWIV